MDKSVHFKPKQSFFDLAGSGAKEAALKDMKDLLDKLQEEDA
jgi:hypothetical protein